MTTPITINQRTATTVGQLVDRMNQTQETLRTYIEAVGAALDVPPGWRFDVQQMAFVAPAEQGEFVGLEPEFAASHESAFCGASADPEQESIQVA